MKRIFLVCAVAVSAMALATASNSSGKITPASKNSCYQDTIPKKDTTKKPKDSTLFSLLFKK